MVTVFTTAGGRLNYSRDDLIDPRPWLARQSYEDLKIWLRHAIFVRQFLPLIVSDSLMPATHLIELLLHSPPHMVAHFRSIIPELLREWIESDSVEALDDLLMLCGSLSCGEAEDIIADIVNRRLSEDDEVDMDLRLRALGVLQTVGSRRTVHVFKGYLREIDYAPICYRGLYLRDLSYAVTELPNLVNLYQAHSAEDDLRDVLEMLFDEETLKPSQYIEVLRPLAERYPEDTLIEALELLHSIGVFGDVFFLNLAPGESAELFGLMMKRVRLEDCEALRTLLGKMGVSVEPAPALYPVTQETGETTAEQPLDLSTTRGYDFSMYLPATKSYQRPRGDQSGKALSHERHPLTAASELGDLRSWAFSREMTFEQFDFDAMLEAPVGPSAHN
jgi:hypothetical protein